MNPLLQRLTAAYASGVLRAGTLHHPLMLLVRLQWGYGFFRTGLGKLSDLPATAEFFASLGIPFPHLNAVAAGSTEMVGGALLALGLASRIAAVPLIGVMATAFATDDREALLGVFSDPQAFVDAVPFQYLLASLLVLTYGPGAFSLDVLIARFRRRTSR